MPHDGSHGATRLSLSAADARAALLGLQLDRRPRPRARHPADGDDVLPLVVRDHRSSRRSRGRTCAASGRSIRAQLEDDARSLGAIGIGTHNALAYIGLNYTTATNGVILNSFIPVMIVAMSWVFLRERLTPLQLAGVLVSLAGVLDDPVAGQPRRAARRFDLNGGDLLVILSMAMWSLYTIGLRWRPAGLHMLTFLFVDRVHRRSAACCRSIWREMAFGRHMVVDAATNFAALVARRAVLVGAGLHLLESRRRAGRRERRRALRPPDAGVRRRARVAVPGRALALSMSPASRSSCRHLDHEPAGTASAPVPADRLTARASAAA